MPAFERRHFFRIITTPHLLLQKPVSKEFVIDAVSAQILRDEVCDEQSFGGCLHRACRQAMLLQGWTGGDVGDLAFLADGQQDFFLFWRQLVEQGGIDETLPRHDLPNACLKHIL